MIGTFIFKHLVHFLTSGLCCLVVLLTDQFVVCHEEEFITRRQLSCTDDATEAVKMVDVVQGAPDDLRRGDAFLAGGTLGAESPREGRGGDDDEEKEETKNHNKNDGNDDDDDGGDKGERAEETG